MLKASQDYMLRLLCFADLHGNFEIAKKIESAAHDYDVLICAGDLTNFYSRDVARSMIEKLIRNSRNFLAVPGNCDLKETLELLESMKLSLHGRGRVISKTGFFGIGGSNLTPFNTPLEFSEDYIYRMLEKGYAEIKNSRVKILVSHSPPYSFVDLTPSGEHIGSRALKDFISLHDINLVICGHAHEAKGVASFKDTLIINTSPAKYWLLSVEIDEESGKIDYKFIETEKL